MGKTKCIVLGEEPKEEKLEPIRFERCASEIIGEGMRDPIREPSSWKRIELIMKGSRPHQYDAMFAYDKDRSLGAVYFGYWNDGVAE